MITLFFPTRPAINSYICVMLLDLWNYDSAYYDIDTQIVVKKIAAECLFNFKLINYEKNSTFTV